MAQAIGKATGTWSEDKSSAANTFCNKTVTVEIKGSTGDWSKALIKDTAAIKTYSDGYNVKFSVTLAGATAATVGAGYGACFNVGSGPAVIMSAKSAANNAHVAANNSYTNWLKDKEVADNVAKQGAAAIWTIGTAMSLGTQGLVMTPDPTKTMTGYYATGKIFTAFWYQPKETKDKKYKDMVPRWSKAETLKYTAFQPKTGIAAPELCTSTVLKGATTLVAGVAFGVAALF